MNLLKFTFLSTKTLQPNQSIRIVTKNQNTGALCAEG